MTLWNGFYGFCFAWVLFVFMFGLRERKGHSREKIKSQTIWQIWIIIDENWQAYEALRIWLLYFLTFSFFMSDKLETCPICHKQMLSHDLAQVNQCMKDFIKKSCGNTQFDTWEMSISMKSVNQCMKDFIKKSCGKTFFETWEVKT